MQDYFKDEFFVEAKAQRKKAIIYLIIILAIYALLSGGNLWWYLTLTYKSPTITTVKIVEYSITAVFVVIVYVYVVVCYNRVNNFYLLCNNIIIGLKETSVVNFFEYDEKLYIKDGVDMKLVVFLEWNKFKKDYYERKVYVFFEKEFPKFEPNQEVKIITQGNVLVSYEIIDEKQ